MLERFLREIRAVAKLRHPNIVTAYHATRLGQSTVFAMEYVEGYDLAQLVRGQGPLPVSLACNFVYQAALGLQHAHEEGLVHRDIKAGNLMLSRKGNKATVKVLDFGLAKATREEKVDGGLTSEGQALGTPDFIAPEQILDAPNADIRADIYSLGATLYYLLSGRPPFQANSLYDMYQAHISRDADLLNFVRPEVPAELASLVSKMMAKDPARRFQTPAEVAQALAPFFKSGAVRANVETSRAGQSGVMGPMTRGNTAPTQPATSAAGQVAAPRTSARPSQPDPRWDSLIDLKETERSSDGVKPKPATAGLVRRPPWMTWPAIAAASLFGLIALGIIIYVATDKGRIKIVVDGLQPIVKIDGETVRIEGLDETITLRAGTHELAVKWGDGEFKTRTLVVRRGDNGEFRVEYEPKPAPDNPPVPPVASWVSLFNGKDLTGWVVDGGDENAWKAKSGELVVHGADKDFGGKGQGYLLTDRDYTDFHLRFQFQRSSDTATSGIALRAVPHETPRNSDPVDSADFPVHLTVWLGKFPTLYRQLTNVEDDETGALWWSFNTGIQQHLNPDHLAEVKRIGEWNDMQVEMRGQSLRIDVNGREVLNVMLDKTRPENSPAPGLNRYSGRIGFLKRTGEVRFRNIEIKEPVPSRVKDVPAILPAPQPPETVTNTLGMKLTLIPAGEFMMGSPAGQGDGDEHPQHRVRITRPFYLGKYEVTQGQYETVMNENPSQFKESDDLPVENVFWLDAIKFCNKLSERESRKPFYRIAGHEVSIAGGDGYRLPTEAEWEYACRAGSATVFPFGDDAGELGAYAWYDNNSGQKTHPVGRKRANAWGFHDMVGNVLEWCADWFDEKYYASSPVSDPPGATKGLDRVIRGGGWYYGPHASRPADRWSMPEKRFSSLGFRVALVQSGRDVDSRIGSPPGKPTISPATKPLETVTNTLGMKLTLIPAGEFMMGSPDGDKDARNDEKPQHRVRITRPFYLGVTEVTRGQFRLFVDETGYKTEAEKDGKGGWCWNDEAKKFEGIPGLTWKNAGFEQTDEHPVVNVSWNDAQEFIAWLSQKDRKTYRLPTEAEWEYACRAGTKTKYFCGDDPEGLATVGNIADGTFRQKNPTWIWTIAARDGYVYTAPVGRFRANAFGLYDIHGNVFEWCQDWYDPEYYKRSPVDDPVSSTRVEGRLFRGGAWDVGGTPCRSGYRYSSSSRSSTIGFRLALGQSGR